MPYAIKKCRNNNKFKCKNFGPIVLSKKSFQFDTKMYFDLGLESKVFIVRCMLQTVTQNRN